jgi:hypothetical protein
VTFLVTYLHFLIKELDNPFDYARTGRLGDNISLKPLTDTHERLAAKVKDLKIR